MPETLTKWEQWDKEQKIPHERPPTPFERQAIVEALELHIEKLERRRKFCGTRFAEIRLDERISEAEKEIQSHRPYLRSRSSPGHFLSTAPQRRTLPRGAAGFCLFAACGGLLYREDGTAQSGICSTCAYELSLIHEHNDAQKVEAEREQVKATIAKIGKEG